VVEGARLESECWGNSTVGSNPTLSATYRTVRGSATPISNGLFRHSGQQYLGPARPCLASTASMSFAVEWIPAFISALQKI
jgi:hypothetical protein